MYTMEGRLNVLMKLESWMAMGQMLDSTTPGVLPMMVSPTLFM